jgi:hypothetical protein
MVLSVVLAAASAAACPDHRDPAVASACDDGTAAACKVAMEQAQQAEQRLVEGMRHLDGYRVALATSLARQDTPDGLLAAATAVTLVELESPLPQPVGVPAALASSALLARATTLAPGDARIAYAAAKLDACKDAAPCPADAALAHLLEIDGDNAAAWLAQFERATARNDAATARLALARAARAPALRDYVDALEQAVLREWLADATSLPVDPASVKTALTPMQYGRWFKLTEVSTALLGATAANHPLTRACDPQGAARDDPALRADCRAIAAKMDTAAAGLFTQSQGRFLRARLADDPAGRARLQARARELKWLLHEGRWPVGDDVDLARMEEELQLRQAGVGDVERRRRIAAARGLAFSPDWREPARHAEDE